MLLKVIKYKEQSYFYHDNQKQMMKSEMYNGYLKRNRMQRQDKKFNRENDKTNQEHKIKCDKERTNTASLMYTCFACATLGHIGVPCSKLAHNELFSNPSPDYVYPHDKITYVATSEKPSMRNQTTSPLPASPLADNSIAPNPVRSEYLRNDLLEREEI